MSPEQFNQLIATLNKLTEALSHSGQYTITGASDWPLIPSFVGLLIILLGVIWTDLRATIKDKHSSTQIALDKEIKDREKQDDLLWVETRGIKATLKDCEDRHEVPKFTRNANRS